MTEREQFIEQIKANPEDHQLKMVFADWLQDHKEPDLAHAYRWCGKHKKHPRITPKGRFSRWHRLKKNNNKKEFTWEINCFVFDFMAGYGYKTLTSISMESSFRWLADALKDIKGIIE